MKFFCAILVIVLLLLGSGRCFSQGFINLNFEQANVSGYSENDSVPVGEALPGWQVYNGSSQVGDVPYDAVSLGSAFVSIWDTNSIGTDALQGQYSAVLFSGFYDVSSSISQTGTVPVGSESLTMDIYAASPESFSVTLGGQTLTLTPLSEVSSSEYPYTVYGADISSFAGLANQQLVITCLAAPQTEHEIIVDNIQFLTTPVPEPGVLALCVLGGLLFTWRRPKRLSA